MTTTETKASNETTLSQYSFAEDAFRFFSVYRLIFSISLLLIALTKLEVDLGHKQPELFLIACILYSVLNAWHISRLMLFNKTVSKAALVTTVGADFCFINIITFATGALGTGTELAHLVVVGAASIFLSSRLAFFTAALSAISLLSLNLYFSYLDTSNVKMFFNAGFVGLLFFLFSFTVQFLAARISASQATAQNLEELNKLIVQRLRTGIIVCNNAGRISLQNQAAKDLLEQKQVLEFLPSKLMQALQIWLQDNSVINEEYSPGIAYHFTRLNYQDQDKEILIFIDDNRQLAQQAQQLKLASLGRLTASIAHEIRNPLSAISHASQLLQEAPETDPANQKLTSIIHNHCGRLNQVIEDVLTLSRRNSAKPEKLLLGEFLQLFQQRLEQSLGHEIELDVALVEADMQVPFDPYHLQQVLDNLCTNGLRYSLKYIGVEKLSLNAGIASTGQPYLQILDYGDGIAAEHQSQIFEPFFTTETKGTGLGLYIAKELCEANRAILSYSTDEQSCFTISFSHPQKRIDPK